MKFPTWSAWFPYPSSWVRTGILSIIFIAVVYIVVRFAHAGVITAIALNNLGPLPLMIWIGAMIPFIAYAYLHDQFYYKTKPKDWPPKLPCPLSIWEAFYSFVVMLLSSQFTFAVAMFLINPSHEPTDEDFEFWGWAISVTWLFASAYFFQIEFILRRNIRQPAQSPTTANTTTLKAKPQPIDWEYELNQLRTDMGLHQPKKPKK